MARALVNVPPTAAKGTVVEVKVLIAHPMETGYRPGPDGRIVPRDIITDFTCDYGGTTVFAATFSPAMSANPYLTFTFVAAESGPVVLTWAGDNGFRQVETATLRVT